MRSSADEDSSSESEGWPIRKIDQMVSQAHHYKQAAFVSLARLFLLC